jgi:hypothetical protein
MTLLTFPHFCTCIYMFTAFLRSAKIRDLNIVTKDRVILVRDIPIRDEGTQWRMKKDKRTNNDLQNIHIKLKIE